MVIDFEWNGNGLVARKVRRKLAWHEHKGVAHYDRERMRQPLVPVAQPTGFDGYSAPPSWIGIPASWGKWEPVPVGHFHEGAAVSTMPIADLDDLPIAQTPDYTLERGHVETVCLRGEWRRGEWITTRQPVTYRWELTFADGAVFRFVSRSIAEAALSQLLKIRNAKHPRPKVGNHSPKNESAFFTDRKLRKCPADSAPARLPVGPKPMETAA